MERLWVLIDEANAKLDTSAGILRESLPREGEEDMVPDPDDANWLGNKSEHAAGAGGHSATTEEPDQQQTRQQQHGQAAGSSGGGGGGGSAASGDVGVPGAPGGTNVATTQALESGSGSASASASATQAPAGAIPETATQVHAPLPNTVNSG